MEPIDHFNPEIRSTPIGQLLNSLTVPWRGISAILNDAQDSDGVPVTDTPLATATTEHRTDMLLSVIVRTDGSRPANFNDLMVSLAAQSCGDFEVIVVIAAERRDALPRTEALIGDFHEAFRGRIRCIALPMDGTLTLHSAGAANLGVAAARARYVAFLDDDYVAFGHWAEMLQAVADHSAGSVLHVGVATQQVVATPGRWHRSSASMVTEGRPSISSPPVTAHPAEGTGVQAIDAFDVVDQPRCQESFEVGLLEMLGEPPINLPGIVLPSAFFDELGQEFDASVGPLWEWECALRAVQWCGMATTGEVGLLHRQWQDAGHSDPEVPSQGVAVVSELLSLEARSRVLAKLDAVPMLLGRGSATTLTALVAASRASGNDPPRHIVSSQEAEVLALRAHVEALTASQADAVVGLQAIRTSMSWRVTAPMRRAIDWWHRRRTGA